MENADVLFTLDVVEDRPTTENTDGSDPLYATNSLSEYEDVKRSYHGRNYSVDGQSSFTKLRPKKTNSDNHPNVIKYCGYLARSTDEFLPLFNTAVNNNLHDLILSDENISWNERFLIAEQLADGLNYFHSKSITHGDVKPKNVYLTKSNEVKIFDYGKARRWEHKYRLNDLYWAPERFRMEYQLENQRNLNPWTDVYSFGMILYELITRKQIYEDMVPQPELVPRIQIGLRPNLEHVTDAMKSMNAESLDFKICTFLRHIMEQCWNHDPCSRPSMEEVCSRFTNFHKQVITRNSPKKSNDQNLHALFDKNYGETKTSEQTTPTRELDRKDLSITDQQNNKKFVSKTKELVGKVGAKLTVGGCIVDIPPGALSEDVKIELTASYGNKDKKIELTPELDCKPDGLQFNKPVTISLPTCYKAKTNIPVNIKTSEDTNTWNTLESANHSRDKMIAFETNHFSFFKAFPSEKHTLEQDGMIFAVSKTNDNEVNEYLQQRANQQVCNEKYVSEKQGISPAKKVPSNTVSQVVGPQGGKLESNGCSLVIPPNALSEEITITITPYLNSKLDMTPHIKCGPPGLKFQKNVTITLPICKNENNIQQITVKYCNEGSTWRTLTKSPSCTDANICFQTNHFTRFGVDLQDPSDSQTLEKEKIVKFAVRRSASRCLNRILLTCFFADNLEIIRESDEFRHFDSVHHKEFEMRNEEDPVKMVITCDNNHPQSQDDRIYTRRLALLHYMITMSDEGKTNFNLQNAAMHRMFQGVFYIPELGPTNERDPDHVDSELLRISRGIPNDEWNRFARTKLMIDETTMDNSITDNPTAEPHRKFILVCWNEHGGNDAPQLQQLINRFWQEKRNKP
uniref:Kelch-like protein diablo n=1 Tax=Phallusia mammillata TaxID=59560 RepID=A0A6F9DRL5_9ASCI|nr:kelch-like protein diablo [Phallusia mammillata]